MKKLLLSTSILLLSGTALAAEGREYHAELPSNPNFNSGVIETGIPFDKIEDRTSRYLLEVAQREAEQKALQAKQDVVTGLPLVPASIEEPIVVDRTGLLPVESPAAGQPLPGHVPGRPAPVFQTMGQAAEAGALPTQVGVAAPAASPTDYLLTPEPSPSSQPGTSFEVSPQPAEASTEDSSLIQVVEPAPQAEASEAGEPLGAPSVSVLPPMGESLLAPKLVKNDYQTWWPWLKHWVLNNQDESMQYGIGFVLLMLLFSFIRNRRKLPDYD